MKGALAAGGAPPDSARWIEALDRQSGIIMGMFATAGFEPIAPPVIQPADLFLDLIGEDLRARTYVFDDPNGEELCLRPDLTIPACRHYLARHGATPQPARYAYSGVVFRYQPSGQTAVRPREFRQAGIESFASEDPARAEVEILALTIESVRAAGLRSLRISVGDLGIFQALLAALPMPERWRERLRHHFWHPEAFRLQLQRLVNPGEGGQKLPVLLLGRVTAGDAAAATAAIEGHIAEHGLTIAGTRTLDEVAEQLRAIGQDMLEKPLPAETAALIEAYLGIEAPADQAPAAVRALTRAARIDIEPAIAAYEARLKLAAEEGIGLGEARFAASFGRAFEYYTGFVFELVSPAIGVATPIAGGGRYDTLIEAMSGGLRVPAVGSAIHTERLLLAVRGGRL